MAFGAILDIAGISIIFFLAKFLTDEKSIVQRFPNILSGIDIKRIGQLAICAAFLLYVTKFIVSIVNSLVAARVSFGVYREISRRLLESYLRQPYEFHIERNSSELTHNVHGTALAIALTVILPTLTLFSEAFVILLFLSVFLWRAPSITGAVLLILIVLGSALVSITKPLFTARGKAAYQASQDLAKLITHTFGSIKEVKIYSAEEFFEHEHSSVARKFAKLDGFHVVSQKFVQPFMELVVASFLIVGAVYLGGSRASGSQYMPLLLVVAMSALRLLPSLVRIANSLQSMQFDSTAARHLFEDISLPKERTIKLAKHRTFTQIEIRDVVYRYPSAPNPIITNVSLSIAKGDAIAITGSSGAGKTTLTDIVLGLLIPTAGLVLVDGRPGRAYQLLNVAYVPQQVYLIDASLRCNIAFGVDPKEIDEPRLVRAIEQAHLSSLIDRLPSGLDMVCGEKGVRLSGGERQRIAIARALYADPELIVMDEPTSALDVDTEGFITTTIAELRRARKTIIAVTHREGIMRACNRVVHMGNGAVMWEKRLTDSDQKSA